MSFKLVVLLLFIAIAHVGAEVSEDEEPSADGPFMLRFNKEFIDETHWINQVFFREFIKSYGHRDLLKKSDRLQWLVKNPPYGKYKDLCVAYTMMRRDLFYLGSIVSDYMFIYFSTLGRTLQRASNEDGSPKPYLKYFDKVSLHLGCQGYEADELMLNLADYFDDAATDFGPLAKKYKVNAEMEAMQQRLKHINEQPDVVYNAKDCNDMKMEGYLLDKLKEIKEAYEKLADTANDDEVGDLFKMYRDISPVASTFFLCIGAKNKLAEEVDGQVIYQMRQVMATMMTKEQEKEKILLSTIKNASFHMDLRHNRRMDSILVFLNEEFAPCPVKKSKRIPKPRRISLEPQTEQGLHPNLSTQIPEGDGKSFHCQTGAAHIPFCSCVMHEKMSRIKLDSIEIMKTAETLDEFEGAIAKYSKNFKLSTLRSMKKMLSEEEKKKIISLLRNVAHTSANYFLQFGKVIPLLSEDIDRSLILSKKQVETLISCAFLSIFPDSRLDFQYIHTNDDRKSQEKMANVLHYIYLSQMSRWTGQTVGYHKWVTKDVREDIPSKKISEIDVRMDYSRTEDAENASIGCFSNKTLGGGVLRRGYLQEEKLLITHPETLLVLHVHPHDLSDEGVMSVTGAESLEKGFLNEKKKVDSRGMVQREIVLYDALNISQFELPSHQFQERYLKRELRKLTTAFTVSYGPKRAFATGKWGCGDFGGNKELKAILQIIAAALCERDLYYHCYGDVRFGTRLKTFLKVVEKKDVGTETLWKMVQKVDPNISVFDSVISLILK